ncbi:hypothetical protein ABXN37_13360 [Piscinibacter sakaiensis]|uniref:hypothetical protein n=1 Tax=Piscinibacter sakaiensis TaxID=1547922 RepID=UPI001E4EABFC|nr:hypothetical protein [Piscinibacter sakaiensis]
MRALPFTTSPRAWDQANALEHLPTVQFHAKHRRPMIKHASIVVIVEFRHYRFIEHRFASWSAGHG